MPCIAVLTAGVWLTASAAPAWAQNSTPDKATLVKSIFETGWKASPTALERTQQLRQTVKGARDNDLSYAYGLVMLRNHQYDEASQHFDAMTVMDSNDHRGWRASIWTKMLVDQPEEALLRVDRFQKLIPAAEVAPEEESEILNSIRLVAQVLAFLEGPRNGAVSEEVLKRMKTKWQPLLVGQRSVAFDDAFEELLDEYLDTTSKQSAVQQTAREEGEAEMERQREELIRQRRLVAQQLVQADVKIDERRKAWRDEEKEFEKREAPYNSAIQQLEIRQRNIIRNIRAVQREIANIYAWMNSEQEERRLRSDPTFRLTRLEQLRIRHQTDLDIVQVELQQAILARDRVRAERLATQRQYQAEIQATLEQKNELNRIERRSAAQQKRTERPVSGNTSEARALGSKANSWRSLSDFSLDVERFELLTAF